MVRPPARVTWSSIVIAVALVATGAIPALGLAQADPEDTWEVNDRVRAVVQVGDVAYLGGRFSALHDGGGRPRGETVTHERVQNHLQLLDGHEQDDRPSAARQGLPGQRRRARRGTVLGLVAGGDGDHGRVIAVGERDARVGGHGDGRGHAGNDLEGHPREPQRFGLLAAATEQRGIAVLEP